MKTLILALLVGQLAGAPDAGVEKPTFYRLTKQTLVPPGYYAPPAAFDALDAEMKRLQAIEKDPPMQTIDIPVQGYLIGMAVTGVVFFAGGIALGYYFWGQK